MPISLILSDPSVQSACPSCRADIRVDAFPALFHDVAPGSSGEALFTEGESSCFYHSAKKAVVPCEGCGRFLCSLCDIELDGKHLCPTCIEKGVKKGKLERLQADVTRYDDIAMLLAVVPLIFFCVTVFTAPAALFIAVRHWNSPGTVTPRGKWRFVAAIILSSLEMIGWGIAAIRLMGNTIFK